MGHYFLDTQYIAPLDSLFLCSKRNSACVVYIFCQKNVFESRQKRAGNKITYISKIRSFTVVIFLYRRVEGEGGGIPFTYRIQFVHR